MTINELLKKEYEYLSKTYEVYGVFLYGSQNYGLSTDESDFDTKAIVIPSFEDLMMRKPVSKIIDFGSGECDVKDIREMIKNYKKQNVNFVETLFTVYSYVNPKYEKFHDELLHRRGDIARMDERRALECMNGLLGQAKKRMTNVTDKTRAEIEEFGYHRKSLLNVLKMSFMVDKYIQGQHYMDVLDCSNLRKFRDNVIEKEAAFKTAEKYDARTYNAVKKYLEKNNPQPNTEVSEWLDKWVMRVVSKNIKPFKG